MGIDPLTHKPLNTGESPSSPPQQQEQEQQQNQSYYTNAISELDENKELETSLQSNVTDGSKEEDKNMTSTFESMEIVNGFCIDEVPIIEPHEMLVPCAPSSSTSSSSSSSYGSNNIPEYLQFPDFEWPNNNIGLWDDDLSSWDLLLNDADSERKLATAVDPLLNQCPRMVLDQDSWAYELL